MIYLRMGMKIHKYPTSYKPPWSVFFHPWVESIWGGQAEGCMQSVSMFNALDWQGGEKMSWWDWGCFPWNRLPFTIPFYNLNNDNNITRFRGTGRTKSLLVTCFWNWAELIWWRHVQRMSTCIARVWSHYKDNTQESLTFYPCLHT